MFKGTIFLFPVLSKKPFESHRTIEARPLRWKQTDVLNLYFNAGRSKFNLWVGSNCCQSLVIQLSTQLFIRFARVLRLHRRTLQMEDYSQNNLQSKCIFIWPYMCLLLTQNYLCEFQIEGWRRFSADMCPFRCYPTNFESNFRHKKVKVWFIKTLTKLNY